MADYFSFIENYKVGEPDECWKWTGTKWGERGRKYGAFHTRTKSLNAHRVMFFLRNGFFPEDVHHKCENRLCVNWNHLEGMTHSEHTKLHRQMEENPICGRFGDESLAAKYLDEELKKLFPLRAQGFGYQEISEIVGVPLGTVAGVLRGGSRRHLRQEAFAKMTEEEKGRFDNAETYVRARTAPKGENSGSAKFTEEQIRHAFRLKAEGIKQKKISEVTGISQSSLSTILRGRAWKHLGIPLPPKPPKPVKCKKSRPTYSSKGFLEGVQPTHSGRFRARLQLNGKRVHLGVRATQEEAHALFTEAKSLLSTK